MKDARAVFLDRDGVLNAQIPSQDGVRPPWVVEELELLPQVRAALKLASAAGFRCIVVTNQPDVARGGLNRENLEEIHTELVRLLPEVSAVYVCTHDNGDACACRKPLPGLLLEAQQHHGINLSLSWLVGDRWIDIAAAAAVGCSSVLVDTPTSWKPTSVGAAPSELKPTAVAANLYQAVNIILENGA